MMIYNIIINSNNNSNWTVPHNERIGRITTGRGTCILVPLFTVLIYYSLLLVFTSQ